MSGPYRVHVLSLPWTRTDEARFSNCAYTTRACRFGEMFVPRGHEVFLYSGIGNTAVCTEHIVAITEEEQADILGTSNAPWNPQHPAWIAMNARCIEEITKRAELADFLYLTCGPCQQSVADALPHLTAFEGGVGYHATSTRFRAYESAAHMHARYGADAGSSDYDGRAGDCYIPNFFRASDFHVAPPDDPPYFLFIGRGVHRKGAHIAGRVAEHLDVRLVIAGEEIEPGGFPTYGERVGVVDPARRAVLMAGATATFVPTQYGGPFEGVAVEAMLSGCPVITTDYGVFTETVSKGDGWRCHTMAEFVDAARAALRLTRTKNVESNRRARRDRAVARFSFAAVAPQYERWLGRLMELWNTEGWGALEHPDPEILRAIAYGERPA